MSPEIVRVSNFMEYQYMMQKKITASEMAHRQNLKKKLIDENCRKDEDTNFVVETLDDYQDDDHLEEMGNFK